MPTIHLLIKGEVQGVFYRATAREVAGKLNVKGWIMNTKNGDVEAVVTADDNSLQKFIEWCKKGPSKATVEDVIVTPAGEEQFNEFEVIRGQR